VSARQGGGAMNGASGTVDGAMAAARAAGVDRLDAQLLLARLLGQTRTWLMAHGEARLDGDRQQAFAALCTRRARGEPLAYLIGEREFHGLALTVGPGVLVPRPDTETLVDWALRLLAGPLGQRPLPRVLDLGTGSGAIALALSQGCPQAEVWAVDRSPQALAVARTNAARLRRPLHFAEGDWFGALDATAGRFDLVVANPPYIAPDDPHLAALQYEPQAALVAQDGGLADLRRIAADAGPWLSDGGWLLLEHGCDQAPAVGQALANAGFADIATQADLAGQPRCTGGRRADTA